jgi:hypothetical protein
MKSWEWSPPDGISALEEETSESYFCLKCDDTARRPPPACRKESSLEPTRLAPPDLGLPNSITVREFISDI